MENQSFVIINNHELIEWCNRCINIIVGYRAGKIDQYIELNKQQTKWQRFWQGNYNSDIIYTKNEYYTLENKCKALITAAESGEKVFVDVDIFRQIKYILENFK